MFVLSTAFTDKSDQFCVIECLLSWFVANKSSYDMDFVHKILSKAIHHWSGRPENMNVQKYCTSYLYNTMNKLQIPPSQYDAISKITKERLSFDVRLAKATVTDELFLQLSGNQSCSSSYRLEVPFNVTATLYQDRIPKVSCDKSFGNYHLYVCAWKVENSKKTTRLPLYCDPDSAYKTLKLFPFCDCHSGRLLQANKNMLIYISFSVLWVGV